MRLLPTMLVALCAIRLGALEAPGDRDAAAATFGHAATAAARLVASSAPANILYAGEPLQARISLGGDAAWLEIVPYGLRTRPGGDMFAIETQRTGQPVRLEFRHAGSEPAVDVALPIPERFGGYAIVLERPDGRRELIGSCVRVRKPPTLSGRERRLAMDIEHVPSLLRLGAAPNRIGCAFRRSDEPGYEEYYQRKATQLRAYHAANLPVIVEFGHETPMDGPIQPLGRRRQKLDDDGRMRTEDNGVDIAWLPGLDPAFGAFVKRMALEFGWPKGPINAMKLWNEPWEGGSIAGWQADIPRFVEMQTTLNQAVEEARAEGGVRILLGGTDSSSNTFDKLFGDGSTRFLPQLDFMSLHYQGLSPASTVRMLVDRQSPEGRTRIWDTESWCANSDERVAAILPTMVAVGYDRLVGIQSNKVVTTIDTWEEAGQRRELAHTWSVGAAVAAFQDLLGERRFTRMLWDGLPWVFSFDGLPGADGKPRADDRTVVVVADLDPVFGQGNVLHGAVRCRDEVADRGEEYRQLSTLAPFSAERVQAEMRLRSRRPFTNAWMDLDAAGGRIRCFDGLGNELPAAAGRLRVPLDASGWYLRPDGSPGSGDALLVAVGAARIEGLQPVDLVVRDATGPLRPADAIEVEVQNILNRSVAGELRLSCPGLGFAQPERIALQPHEHRTVRIRLTEVAADPRNARPLQVEFDAGADGLARHAELLRGNLIARRTVRVDGDLADWDGVLPQTMVGDGTTLRTDAEIAWLPGKTPPSTVRKGMATTWFAADEDNFYLAARIADDTPHPGTHRWASLDHDWFFYPEVCWLSAAAALPEPHEFSVRWTGQLRSDLDGDHVLTTRSDDGIRVWLDGRQVIDNWTGHGPTEDQGTVHLVAGRRHDLRIEYFQGGGPATLQLFWQQPGRPRTIIPAASLHANAQAGSGGLSGAYFRGTGLAGEPAQTRIDPVIDQPRWAGRDPGDADFGRMEAKAVRQELRWPAGVRRYTYRRDFAVPAGNAPNIDNIQVAFNVLPPEAKPWYPAPPGCVARFADYRTTDYEFALNQVAPEHGGGTEIWRLRSPTMPDKHCFPRQPASAADGAVAGALVQRYEAGWRIVEAAIPWSEVPEGREAMRAGRTIKLSVRVNDDAGIGCLELARFRSVSRRSYPAFKVDWVEHWANELQFGFAPAP